jgi:hypothetical protein
MEANPYHSPIATNDPARVRGRLMKSIDVIAIICAPMPAIYMATMFVVARLTEAPSLKFITVVVVLGLISFLLCFVSGIYNLIGCCQGRRLAVVGIVLNLISVVAWTGLTLYRLLTVGPPDF